MKNVFVFIVCVLLLCSCSDGLEKEAKKHLNNYIEEFAHNPDTYKIRNMKTIYNTDSVCIIQFVGNGENLFGGHKSTHYEYVFVKARDKKGSDKFKYMEVLVNLDGDDYDYCKPVIEQGENMRKFFKDMTDDELIYFSAWSKALMSGRDIEIR